MPKSIPFAVLAILTAACSSSSGGGSPSLYGTWYYADSAGAGVGLTFNQSGTYVAQELALTSSTSGDDQAEKGTFTVSGSTITLTPTEWSCPGPDPIYKLTYSFQGSDLAVSQPSGAAVLQPDTQPPSSVAITFGCFTNGDSGEIFTPEPLAPVSN
jgi:hypothetical protein